jgi:N-acetylneuraminate epimerase
MKCSIGCLFVAAALAAVSAADLRAARVISLPAVPDRHGFAGAFAGVHNGHLLAGGGANFPEGVMPWNGGKKVWHDRVFALAPAKGAAWREIGRLPRSNAYGVSLTIPEGVLIVGAATPFAIFPTCG